MTEEPLPPPQIASAVERLAAAAARATSEEETELKTLWRNLLRLERRLEKVEEALERLKARKARKAEVSELSKNVHILIEEVRGLKEPLGLGVRSLPRPGPAVAEDLGDLDVEGDTPRDDDFLKDIRL